MEEKFDPSGAPDEASGASEKKAEKPKTDLRKQKTRKALEEAFYQLVETKWIEDITVGDLCEKAMVRRATFYKHFEDKYAFFAYVMDNIQRNTNLQQNADPRNITMAEYCLNIARSYLRNYEEHPKLVRRILNSKSRQVYTDILVAQIHQALLAKAEYDKKKGIETEINIQVLASFISGAIPHALTTYETEHMQDMNVETCLRELKTIFERLCAPKK